MTMNLYEFTYFSARITCLHNQSSVDPIQLTGLLSDSDARVISSSPEG